MTSRGASRRWPADGPVSEEAGVVSGESPPPPTASARGGQRAEVSPTMRVLRVFGRVLRVGLGLVVVLAAAFAVAWGVHRYAVTSARFAVETIDVEGARRLTQGRIQELSGIRPGQNLFAVDLSAAESKLRADPWVKQVELRRQLPRALKISLVEYEPRVLALLDRQLFLVTRDAEPFKPVADGDPIDLPVVTGLSIANLARDRQREIDRLRVGLEIVRHYERLPLAKSYPAQEVQLAADGAAVISVGSQGIAMHLGKGPWRKKLAMAARVFSQLAAKGRVPGIVFLDNQAHPERVVVRMR